jgi:hypothetical protein
MVAVAQTFGVNLAINRWNAWVFDWDFARVDFGDWSRNLELGWQWDETQFGVNMFAHPYHGSLYFEAARANCLAFWESIPVVFLASWTWEFLGETHRPSLNDFWMTGFGGVAIGEILNRASVAVIDEEASGGERIAREVAATLINPVGGLNRLVRGQWTDRGVNRPDRIPSTYLFQAKAGARRVQEVESPAGPTSSPTLLAEVRLGNVFDTEYTSPFDVVSLLVQVSPDGGGVNLFRALGRLYGRDLNRAGGLHRHAFVVSQRFDYVNNPAYRFGEQSLEAGIQSRWAPPGPAGLRVTTRLAADLVFLGAIDALGAGQGHRDIDYGPGVGALLEVALERGGVTYLSFYNRVRYLWPVSGAPADHTLLFSGLDVSIPITSQIGIGAFFSGDRRQSIYTDFPDDERSYLESRIYVTWTPVRRTPGMSP